MSIHDNPRRRYEPRRGLLHVRGVDVLLSPSTTPLINVPAAAAELVANLAREAKAARLNRKLTVGQAAKQIGVTTSTLTRIEAGATEPTRQTIVLVLRWLGR